MARNSQIKAGERKAWSRKHVSVLLTVFVILTVLDQYTKYLAVLHLKGKEEYELIPGVLHLSYVENYGAAFGILQNSQWLLLGVSICMAAFLLLCIMRVTRVIEFSSCRDGNIVGLKKYYAAVGCLTALIAGAVGNMIDRIRLGYVVDFLYAQCKNLPVLSFDFPVFNLADCYVTVSTILLFMIALIWFKDEDFKLLFGSKKDFNLLFGSKKDFNLLFGSKKDFNLLSDSQEAENSKISHETGDVSGR